MTMQTPLNKVRGSGSAKSGTEHFWHQRLTAIANIPLVILALIIVVSLAGAGYQDVVSRLSNPFITLALAAMLVSVTWHMKLGMQVVIEDYVHSHVRKYICLIANVFFTVGACLLGLYALLKLSFGA